VARTDESRGVRITAMSSLADLGDVHAAEMIVDVLTGNFATTTSDELRRGSTRSTWKWAGQKLERLGAKSMLPRLEQAMLAAPFLERLRYRRLIKRLRSET
jgi:HEAT repeat protein